MRTGSPVSDPSKPSGPGTPGTVVTGFRPLADDVRWDRQPIYRIVEILRDGNGRVHRQGCVWHNDIDRLRRFGRAVAANTASLKVLITNSHGDVVEELAVATPDERHAAWHAWESISLPPAPPVRKAMRADDAARMQRPIAQPTPAPAAESPAAQAAPPDIPKLPVDQAAGIAPILPKHESTLP